MGIILLSQRVMATFKENTVQSQQALSCGRESPAHTECRREHRRPPAPTLPTQDSAYSPLPGIVLVTTADPASGVTPPGPHKLGGNPTQLRARAPLGGPAGGTTSDPPPP